jgi:Probable cobalt transporter subunit (CbtA)
MADTSAAFPATDRAAPWPGTGWLRVAVLAGLVGGLAAAAWNGAVGESVLGAAIRLEEAGAEHVSTVAEPFTRGEQQGGMVVGELVLGAGLGLLLAGAALIAGKAFLGSTRRAWLGLAAAGAWSFLVLPAVKYPALPPGLESTLAIDTRRLSYLALVGAGVLGAVLARAAWLLVEGRLRPLAVLVAVAFPAALAITLLPDEQTVNSMDAGLLLRFRLAAIGGQTLFWALTAVAGLWLLDHHLSGAVRSIRSRLARSR